MYSIICIFMDIYSFFNLLPSLTTLPRKKKQCCSKHHGHISLKTSAFYFWLAEDAGRDRGQEEKGMTEDEMAGWHLRLYGHEFE